MRYPPNHKEATRRRILDAASQAFRERGVAETGVDELIAVSTMYNIEDRIKSARLFAEIMNEINKGIKK